VDEELGERIEALVVCWCGGSLFEDLSKTVRQQPFLAVDIAGPPS
jgi:hypothetical protein